MALLLNVMQLKVHAHLYDLFMINHFFISRYSVFDFYSISKHYTYMIFSKNKAIYFFSKIHLMVEDIVIENSWINNIFLKEFFNNLILVTNDNIFNDETRWFCNKGWKLVDRQTGIARC